MKPIRPIRIQNTQGNPLLCKLTFRGKLELRGTFRLWHGREGGGGGVPDLFSHFRHLF